jgi:hypothetical protein
MKDAEQVLVVAERAADPHTLVEMLARRAHAGPLEVTLLVPATLYGLDWAGDPRAAIEDALGVQRFAEIVISRPPKRVARLLRVDLPSRVIQASDAPVTWLRAPRLRAGRSVLRRWRSRSGPARTRAAAPPATQRRPGPRTLRRAPHSP